MWLFLLATALLEESSVAPFDAEGAMAVLIGLCVKQLTACLPPAPGERHRPSFAAGDEDAYRASVRTEEKIL